MNHANAIENIIVWLDVLLDTRLGTIARMDQDLAVRVLSSNYHLRLIDEFEGVDKQEFDKLYKARDIETLKHSPRTNMLRQVISSYMASAITHALQRGAEPRCKLVINTHPYNLDEEEKEVLRQTVAEDLANGMSVEVVMIPDEFLTPSHCVDNYGVMIRYDYNDWFELHVAEFNSRRMHSLKLIVPNIYTVSVPTAEQVAEHVKEFGCPPRELEEFLGKQIANFEMIDVTFFSVMSDTPYGHIRPPTPDSTNGAVSEDGATVTDS